jgi:signal transduction histidine kinase
MQAGPTGQKEEVGLLLEEYRRFVPIPVGSGKVRAWIRGLLGGSLAHRFGPIRLALMVCALGYLAVEQRSGGSTGAGLAKSLPSVALIMFGGYWPLPVAFGQAAILAASDLYSTSSLVGIKVAASIAVFEVTLRRRGWQPVAGALAVAAAYFIGKYETLPGDTLPLLYKVAVVAGGPMLVAAYVRSLQELARNAEERAEEAERRREMAERAARMAERTAIARELHDVVAHHMASMALRVGVARHVLPQADPRVTEVFNDVHASATTALADLRRLLTALRDPAAVRDDPARLLGEPTELPAAVNGIVENARQSGFTITSSVSPELGTLDAVRGLTVLRLVQEGLTNVAKHAGPSASVRLIADLTQEGVRLEISNDRGLPGTLSSVNGSGPSNGHGLLGMRERVDLVGGTLEAGPTKDGWRLCALLPEPAVGSQA